MQYLFIFLSYLVGSIPFGLILGKAAGIDVRQSGSGNIGATNVSRLVGKKIGAFNRARASLMTEKIKLALPIL